MTTNLLGFCPKLHSKKWFERYQQILRHRVKNQMRRKKKRKRRERGMTLNKSRVVETLNKLKNACVKFYYNLMYNRLCLQFFCRSRINTNNLPVFSDQKFLSVGQINLFSAVSVFLRSPFSAALLSDLTSRRNRNGY
mmetsp:Transcript_3859/g.4230  ORF Transcript_3859/g.4230 Transcript_3859/m.4230 type:complete len:137 (+) Transcript_3859:857-1267(+)